MPNKEAGMLVTRQKVLQRFWYPVMPVARLDSGPQPFTLLGQNIVLWLDGTGRPAALIDRCCHRTAKLSLGFIDGGAIACGYHGWTYDRSGRCIRIPQAKDPTRTPNFKVEAYRAEERYGYVWVCLGEPLSDIPDIAEAGDPGFRQIHEFYEVWNCGALRVMENSFDNAHFSYVHRSSFGDVKNPEPAEFTFIENDWGFEAHSLVPVLNPDLQKKNLKIESERTVRDNLRTWWMPFSRKLRIKYPSGLQHVIITAATPIDDSRTQIVQFAFRNDREEDAPAKDIIAFDRKVTDEDRLVLEATDFDSPLDAASGEEFHMPSDRPGMIMRRKLLKLLTDHGEHEMRGRDLSVK
jgi:phenylpropionate dioxygenase-like ring-hydroxylating dioxygenase large terminal subunit